MILYHATLKSNLESIRENGLDPDRATGKEKLVWLHTKSRREWAVLHTANRYNVSIDEIVIIQVNVPRSQLRRRWRGLWSTPNPITKLDAVCTASILAETPINRLG